MDAIRRMFRWPVPEFRRLMLCLHCEVVALPQNIGLDLAPYNTEPAANGT